jgi:hypothetical protein
VFPKVCETVEEETVCVAWFEIVVCLLVVEWASDVAGLLAMFGAEEVVLCLEASAECGGNWVGGAQRREAVELSISVTLNADATVEGGGAVCNNQDCFIWPVIVVVDDCVCVVAGHGASVAKEVKHFM